MLPSKKNEDVHNPAIVNYELQRLANETKHKSAKKKVNLASVRTGKQNDAHLDLLKLVETLVKYILQLTILGKYFRQHDATGIKKKLSLIF